MIFPTWFLEVWLEDIFWLGNYPGKRGGGAGITLFFFCF